MDQDRNKRQDNLQQMSIQQQGERRGEIKQEQNEKIRKYTFALVPKGECSTVPFFKHVFEGCTTEAQAEKFGNVVCECIDTSTFPFDKELQAEIIANLTSSGAYDGLALAVHKRTEALSNAISDAVDAGIAFVTFDSDYPESKRQAYIGTDNAAMGREFAKVLLQINPEGGKYAFVSARSANLIEREDQTREALNGTLWTEIGDGLSPILGTGNGTVAVERMFKLAEAHPDLKAIVSVYQNPMLGTNWKDFARQYEGKITLVNADASDQQIDLLRKGYTDALVGQVPYDMGKDIVTTLMKLQQNDIGTQSEVLGTNMLEILRVPLVLPPLQMDYNYIGNVVILGYVCFGIVAALSIGFAIWTFINRKTKVVMKSQPIFLILLCLGVLTFGSSIIPLGIDDENHSVQTASNACMAVPWLFSLGFVLIFSALFSKTWRVNKIFHNPNKFSRMKVTPRDVALPMIILLTVNLINLICWTTISPLVFRRTPDSATDLWNRSTSSTGICDSEHMYVFLSILGACILIVLIMANVQAYRARDIETEFSESKHIAMVLASLLQACVIVIPVLIIGHDSSTARYVIVTLLVFVVSVVVILAIFLPKFFHHRQWLADQEKKRKEKEAKKLANQSEMSTASTASDAGNSGLKIKMKQSITVRPGERVSIIRSKVREHSFQKISEEDIAESDQPAQNDSNEEEASSHTNDPYKDDGTSNGNA